MPTESPASTGSSAPFALASRTTRSGRHLTYRLSVIQQPERARACGSGSKAHTDRRPVDPPPLCELRIFEGPSSDSHTHDPKDSPNLRDITFEYSANFFLFATLEHARTYAHGRVRDSSAQTPPVLTGMPVSGMAYLDCPREAGYFLFPDLAVRHEGRYRLAFNLYEQTKDPANADKPDEDAPPLPVSPFTEGFVDHRLEIKSAVFQVYSAKRFPGLQESTHLSKVVADQGCRVRIRREVRQRKREVKPTGDSGDGEGGGCLRKLRASATPDRFRDRSMSDSSNHSSMPISSSPYAVNGGGVGDGQRRPSVQDYHHQQLPQGYLHFGGPNGPGQFAQPSFPHSQAQQQHPQHAQHNQYHHQHHHQHPPPPVQPQPQLASPQHAPPRPSQLPATPTSVPHHVPQNSMPPQPVMPPSASPFVRPSQALPCALPAPPASYQVYANAAAPVHGGPGGGYAPRAPPAVYPTPSRAATPLHDGGYSRRPSVQPSIQPSMPPSSCAVPMDHDGFDARRPSVPCAQSTPRPHAACAQPLAPMPPPQQDHMLPPPSFGSVQPYHRTPSTQRGPTSMPSIKELFPHQLPPLLPPSLAPPTPAPASASKIVWQAANALIEVGDPEAENPPRPASPKVGSKRKLDTPSVTDEKRFCNGPRQQDPHHGDRYNWHETVNGNGSDNGNAPPMSPAPLLRPLLPQPGMESAINPTFECTMVWKSACGGPKAKEAVYFLD